jgi:hypothetical protein
MSLSGVQSIGSVTFKVELQFQNDSRGAALIMSKPRYTSLPKDERIVGLFKSVPGVLRGKFVVTEVISCSAYLMHLSDKSKHT